MKTLILQDFLNRYKDIKARVHSMESFGGSDGPGVRFVLFLQGCRLRCLYCHNPDTWDTHSGQEMNLKDILKKILPYKKFYQNGGVTISGGEPLLQSEFLYDFLVALKVLGFHSAIDTSGVVPLKKSKKCIDEASMLLLDIKEVDERDCVALTGASGENALKTLHYCEDTNKPVWVRYVCVPNYTLSTAKIHALGKILQGLKCVQLVQLLPFHQLGAHKYAQLGLPYKLAALPTPTNEAMQEAKGILASYGVVV